MPNTKNLKGLACPECGTEEPLFIDCTITYMWRDRSIDYDGTTPKWQDDSPCRCFECAHIATVHDFKIENHKTEKESE